MVTLTTVYKVTRNSPIMVTTGILADDGTSISVDYVQNCMDGSSLTVNRIVTLRAEISGVEYYEECLISTRSATSGPGTLNVTRAQHGTSAREWPSGTELAVVLGSDCINDLIDNQIAVNGAVEGTITQCGVHGDTSGNGAHAKIYLLTARVVTLEGHDATLSGGSSTDADTLHTHASLLTKAFASIANKTTIHDSDTLVINDSEESAAIKEVTALVLRGTTHKNLDVASRTLIFLAGGGKVPGYSSATISSIARTGAISDADAVTTTLTCTCTDHGLKSGEYIYLKLVTNTTLNGDYAVTVTSSSQFTVTIASSSFTNDTGNFYVLGSIPTAKFLADDTANQYIEFSAPTPKNLNGSGSLTAEFVFIPDADCSDSTNVIFGIAAKCVGSGDALGAAYGTAVEVSTTVAATNLIGKQITSAASGAITPANSPAGGDTLQCRVYRKYTDSSAVAHHLFAVILTYTTDAYGDV